MTARKLIDGLLWLRDRRWTRWDARRLAGDHVPPPDCAHDGMMQSPSCDGCCSNCPFAFDLGPNLGRA
jgi:hypothetical protein